LDADHPSQGVNIARRITLSSVTGARKAILPAFVPPQFATLVNAAPSGNEWRHEVMLDGYRMLARIDRARSKLVTRHRNDWTEKFEPLVGALAKLKRRTTRAGLPQDSQDRCRVARL
jgi:bifunctional non-homologous end joining protein LigD